MFRLQNELVCCGVLSGNRNFEGRIHPNTRANYLASPLLVIAYAIAGTVNIDFEKDFLGKTEKKKKKEKRHSLYNVYLLMFRLQTRRYSSIFARYMADQGGDSSRRAEVRHSSYVQRSLRQNRER